MPASGSRVGLVPGRHRAATAPRGPPREAPFQGAPPLKTAPSLKKAAAPPRAATAPKALRMPKAQQPPLRVKVRDSSGEPRTPAEVLLKKIEIWDARQHGWVQCQPREAALAWSQVATEQPQPQEGPQERRHSKGHHHSKRHHHSKKQQLPQEQPQPRRLCKCQKTQEPPLRVKVRDSSGEPRTPAEVLLKKIEIWDAWQHGWVRCQPREAALAWSQVATEQPQPQEGPQERRHSKGHHHSKRHHHSKKQQLPQEQPQPRRLCECQRIQEPPLRVKVRDTLGEPRTPAEVMLKKIEIWDAWQHGWVRCQPPEATRVATEQPKDKPREGPEPTQASQPSARVKALRKAIQKPPIWLTKAWQHCKKVVCTCTKGSN
ncbi:uncharacterized protein LOC130458777 [Monodelphis domestica]|uniref:uncharacterized protein LOC130458777 n=1 Tax=Monodelphis domestica TaxID=13616 RepID=UPI0024E223E4|nr:uncharacterized protein LOC130458777 [Monodelphis domestica]